MKFYYLLVLLSSLLLMSCGSQIQLIQKSNKYAILKKGMNVYPVDTTSLGTLTPMKLKSDLKTRILFRDAAKSNLTDALIFIENPEDSIYSNNHLKEVIEKGTPFYLLPRTIYGKTTDFKASTVVKTLSRDIGILFNPYQIFMTVKKPFYIEPNFAGRFKAGVSYSWTIIKHKYSDLNYTRSSFSVGPYCMIGSTSISTTSLDSNMISGVTLNFKNRQEFGTSMGAIINYQVNDFFGTALLIGHEKIYGDIRNFWSFRNKNISFGLVFTFKFSRI